MGSLTEVQGTRPVFSIKRLVPVGSDWVVKYFVVEDSRTSSHNEKKIVRDPLTS